MTALKGDQNDNQLRGASSLLNGSRRGDCVKQAFNKLVTLTDHVATQK